ncbi:hypothetical protein [Actinoplanes sp. RD1]|uniref:hypothetical protein n=1 Tax=Actinoplanes sp. RD1 TaxID=3064538 RepID=UPI00274055C6|nr:hypothetical protein [Actinoplanes sp. RD1]
MKLKLKLSRQQLIVLGIAVLVVVALLFSRANGDDAAQGPGPLDAAAGQACTDFDAGYPDARTKTARLALADKVMQSTGKSENDQIAERAAELGRSAGDGGTEWKTSAGALTTACRDAGWKAP